MNIFWCAHFLNLILISTKKITKYNKNNRNRKSFRGNQKQTDLKKHNEKNKLNTIYYFYNPNRNFSSCFSTSENQTRICENFKKIHDDYIPVNFRGDESSFNKNQESSSYPSLNDFPNFNYSPNKKGKVLNSESIKSQFDSSENTEENLLQMNSKSNNESFSSRILKNEGSDDEKREISHRIYGDDLDSESSSSEVIYTKIPDSSEITAQNEFKGFNCKEKMQNSRLFGLPSKSAHARSVPEKKLHMTKKFNRGKTCKIHKLHSLQSFNSNDSAHRNKHEILESSNYNSDNEMRKTFAKCPKDFRSDFKKQKSFQPKRSTKNKFMGEDPNINFSDKMKSRKKTKSQKVLRDYKVYQDRYVGFPSKMNKKISKKPFKQSNGSYESFQSNLSDKGTKSYDNNSLWFNNTNYEDSTTPSIEKLHTESNKKDVLGFFNDSSVDYDSSCSENTILNSSGKNNQRNIIAHERRKQIWATNRN
ncbi:hypothetical protein EDEG_00016 [Edhazardia aedis USNM 41457]|uniref:Shugoshin C-terminal domain-containing protein n=1 Tax=Edhazardia aedis (strain USNM 41457) TaxID=1003232 RepID=J8ZPR6_EDHAE|nr:hypothetical protein EDEG_00016 [Edhazardia aedis USNM 41457]|eukprot:EJW01683.1 hypothetical protein EDEG_00016 [Edhazardia aedis USNM 41457]